MSQISKKEIYTGGLLDSIAMEEEGGERSKLR